MLIIWTVYCTSACCEKTHKHNMMMNMTEQKRETVLSLSFAFCRFFFKSLLDLILFSVPKEINTKDYIHCVFILFFVLCIFFFNYLLILFLLCIFIQWLLCNFCFYLNKAQCKINLLLLPSLVFQRRSKGPNMLWKWHDTDTCSLRVHLHVHRDDRA